MAVILVTGNGATSQLVIDPTTGAAHSILYGPDGNVLPRADRSAIIPGSTPGLLPLGADYKIARLPRASSEGTMRTGQDTILLNDTIEGANVDTNKWIQTTTTMTIAQATGTGRTYNSGSSFATTVGALQTTNRRFMFMNRAGLVYKTRARATAHFNGNLIEVGFGSPASATVASIGDGAIWRKDATGQYVPVVSMGGSETLGTAISNATILTQVPATDYAIFTVFVEETRATFRITTSLGVVVNEQTIDFTAQTGTFSVTHLQAMERTYNSSATGTAVQLIVAQTSVWMLDVNGYSWQQSMTGENYGSLTSPTLFTQLANYANSIAPVSAALSNTAAGYATLGGQWQFAAVAGAETDFALFGLQIPAPYAFTVQRVSISTYNMGAASATTPTLLQWGLAFNSSTVSLATANPYPTMRKAIGAQSLPTGLAIGANVTPDVVWQGQETVQPNRFFIVILKIPVGTATAAQIIRGTCTVDGYFE
ncbi:MAG: hypothetical protein ACHREM_00330 [Polyangiales bacterium]